MNKPLQKNVVSVRSNCLKDRIRLDIGREVSDAGIKLFCQRRMLKNMQEWEKLRATSKKRNKNELLSFDLHQL